MLDKSSLPRAAVIGAGPAGLATLKALRDKGIPARCFDAGSEPGGLWVFGAVHSSAYRTLHLNTSKSRTEFADFPMPAHWPDYPGHEHIATYLAEYTARFGLNEHISFGHTVTGITQTPGGRWEVTAEGVSDSFDAVIVANGHNSVPKLPDYPGTIAAEQLHSHDYRGPEQLEGKRVLVVGGGNSAMDIAVDASHVADRTLLSMRRGVWVVPKHLLGKPSDTLNGALAKRLPWRLRQRISQTMLRVTVGSLERYGLQRPEHGFLEDHPTLSDALLSRISHGEIRPRRGIERIDGKTVSFADGTSDDVDVIVWCTGYRIDLPFLDPALLKPSAEMMPLYRRVFHLTAPGLMFAGLMQSTGAALPVVEAQGKLIAAYLSGDYTLPSPQRQRADCAQQLKAAHQRWGDRRPAMRIDFDGYLALMEREMRRT
ncbi:flavin-containing monooxygenase [Catelliglobosispora koreensis]|uniref:flavin-containing monooxygenase n=1 Tax=Catelliglobosispora koreensis TaxID=129052 RepID=UPI000372B187|nr:NAD(P)-binding domain-containing protein [Catelliglobosispora koreensis]